MENITFVQAIHDAIQEEMERDETVIILGEDIQAGFPFLVTKGLFEKFGGERVINTPMSENSFMGVATGASLTGMRPIVEFMFDNLMWLAMDQIANQAAKLRYMSGGQLTIPLVIRSPTGFWGSFAAQHSDSLGSVLMSVPGLVLVAPSTPRDAKGLLKSSIRYDGPVVYFEHKMLYSTKGEVPPEEVLLPLGQAEIKRAGSDVTVVAVSIMVLRALEVAATLEAEGVEVEVIDPRTLVPLDRETILESVRKTGRLVIVEDSPRTGGIGAEIAALIADEAFYDLEAPITRVANLDCPMPFSPPLEKFVVPNTSNILEGIRKVLI